MFCNFLEIGYSIIRVTTFGETRSVSRRAQLSFFAVRRRPNVKRQRVKGGECVSKQKGFMPNRIIIAAVMILLQITVTVFLIKYLSEWTVAAYIFLYVISILMVIYILSKPGNESYKTTWIIFILSLPIFGGVLFLLWGNGKVRPRMKIKLAGLRKTTRRFMRHFTATEEALEEFDPIHSRQSKYLKNESHFSVYSDSVTKFLSSGEAFFEEVLRILQNAKKYIFLEYFILAEGYMFDKIFEILKEKAKAGIEVRVIYDDFGSFARQEKGFDKKLKAAGIKVTCFNKIRPSVDIFLNNRDHRKILVVDGIYSVTGGINIGDEYINKIERFGHWLDSGLLVKGPATTSFVLSFCEMWNSISKEKLTVGKYVNETKFEAEGFVQPYTDDPLDDVYPAAGLYREIFSTAKDFVWLTTPYLILDDPMKTVIKSAARAGVDVRIITPKIRDKWYVHPVTRFNYGELLKAGVRIFEYTPGFIHSKTFVSDDSVATVGTVNMDYRSFYFHFECGVWMCGTDAVLDIKDSFLEIQGKSEEIKWSKWRKRPIWQKLTEALLNLFAPFM